MKHVRDGQIVWPYCYRCGCRLEMIKDAFGEFYFKHYEGPALLFGSGPIFVDARGCICTDQIWSLDDRVMPYIHAVTE